MTVDLDPGLARFLEELREADAPSITAGSVEEARAGNAAFLTSMRTEPVDMASVEDIRVPTRSGGQPARRYVPHGEPAGVVTYFHGGGWVMGDLEGHDVICRRFADAAGVIVVNVNYRHAPETPFPGAAEDAADAVVWAASAYDLPVITMGDSAGGNLAASAALAARDAGVDVALQALLYPVLDADLSRDSYRRNGEGYLLTTTDMTWFWNHYIQGGDAFDPRVSVVRADLRGVAPAVIVAAGFDPLVDEALVFAHLLQEQGTECQLLEYPGAIHGFMTLPSLTDLADHAIDAVAERIRAVVGAAHAEPAATN